MVNFKKWKEAYPTISSILDVIEEHSRGKTEINLDDMTAELMEKLGAFKSNELAVAFSCISEGQQTIFKIKQNSVFLPVSFYSVDDIPLKFELNGETIDVLICDIVPAVKFKAPAKPEPPEIIEFCNGCFRPKDDLCGLCRLGRWIKGKYEKVIK